MKRILGVLILSILFSCSNSEENSQVSETSIKPVVDSTNQVDIDSSRQKSTVAQATLITPIEFADLKGKAFVLGGGIDENVCEITEACDCCNADLLFLTEKLFVYDELCEGHYARKGSYKLEGNQITLEFEPRLVSYYHNEESETNLKAPKNILKSENKPVSMETYTIGKCKTDIIITNNNKSEDIAFPVGILKKSASMEGKIGILQQIGAWKMLELK
jgi:hypothetical protein